MSTPAGSNSEPLYAVSFFDQQDAFSLWAIGELLHLYSHKDRSVKIAAAGQLLAELSPAGLQLFAALRTSAVTVGPDYIDINGLRLRVDKSDGISRLVAGDDLIAPGPRGLRGIAGPPGESIAGPPGKDGRDGKDGKEGKSTKGERGERGPRGEKGDRGPAGRDGGGGLMLGGGVGPRGPEGPPGPPGAPGEGFTVSTADWSGITNGTEDRTVDLKATTVDELAGAFGTLVADLRAIGLLK